MSENPPNTKESMYYFMLENKLDEAQQKLLNLAMFWNVVTPQHETFTKKQQKMLLKTDLLAKDTDFLKNLADLLHVTEGMQLNQSVVENMLLGIE